LEIQVLVTLVAVITTSPIMAVVINLMVLEAVNTSSLIVAVAANISQVIMAVPTYSSTTASGVVMTSSVLAVVLALRATAAKHQPCVRLSAPSLHIVKQRQMPTAQTLHQIATAYAGRLPTASVVLHHSRTTPTSASKSAAS
jgi:hypothetical protein